MITNFGVYRDARGLRCRRAAARLFGAALIFTGVLPAVFVPNAVVAAQTPARQAPPALSPPNDTRTPQLRLEMELTRENEPETGAAASAPAPILLASPVLTTLDHSTASVSVTGAAFGFTISLSPTLETQAGAPGAPSTQTLQTLWNVRLAGRDLPGAVTSVSQTGATRTGLARRETLAVLTLRDPKSGAVARYRLTIKATVETAAATRP